jgi:hypothetical protein
MNAAGSVTADELVFALARRGLTLPSEVSTFIVLEGCDAMLTDGPRELAGLTELRISERGVLSLSGPACDDERGARSLHRALVELLRAAGPIVPSALAALAAHGPRSKHFSIGALRDELEAALVPLNRNASRRILARFARDAAQPILDREDVDAALNSLLEAGPPPANDVPGGGGRPRRNTPESPLQVDLFEGMHFEDSAARPLDDELSSLPPPARSSERTPSIRPAFSPSSGARDSLHSLRERAEQLSEQPADPSGSRKLFIGFALIAMAVAGVAFAYSLRSQRSSAGETQAPAIADEPVPVRGGDLTVRVSQPNAQVLRFVGRAPLTVSGLPIGAAHEFVATAEDHRPARVLVPANADWEPTAQGALYEVALQLEQAAGGERDLTLELGPSRLTSQTSEQPSRLGSVRVVSTPRGARVYQLVGFSPEVKVENLPLSEAHELLVYREGFAPLVRAVTVDDFKEQSGRWVAELSFELRKR